MLTGPNGVGKTSVLEAIAYLGTQRSFRGAPREAMVRTGSDRAVLRAELVDRDLPVLVEAELAVAGRSRAQVNRQPARARRDLAAAVPVTVFSPDDLGVVQGGRGAVGTSSTTPSACSTRRPPDSSTTSTAFCADARRPAPPGRRGG